MVAGLVTSKRLGEINLETYNQNFSDLEEVSR